MMRLVSGALWFVVLLVLFVGCRGRAQDVSNPYTCARVAADFAVSLEIQTNRQVSLQELQAAWEPRGPVSACVPALLRVDQSLEQRRLCYPVPADQGGSCSVWSRVAAEEPSEEGAVDAEAEPKQQGTE